MRAIVQRVSGASVEVDGEVVGRCGQGLLALVGAHVEDTEADAEKLARRVATLRVFNDGLGKMNLALGDLQPHGEVLAVSNFTVYGDTAGNRRPSFVAAAPYARGEELFEAFVSALRALGAPVQAGVFGADMKVSLVNDGPVTVILDTR